jgi:hypothetical protein
MSPCLQELSEVDDQSTPAWLAQSSSADQHLLMKLYIRETKSPFSLRLGPWLGVHLVQGELKFPVEQCLKARSELDL